MYVRQAIELCVLLLLLLDVCPVNRDQTRSLDHAVHSCFRKHFSTRYQSVVEPCMILFECHHVRETIRERKRKFLQKFRMSSNQLCVTFRDKATADLDLQWLSIAL